MPTITDKEITEFITKELDKLKLIKDQLPEFVINKKMTMSLADQFKIKLRDRLDGDQIMENSLFINSVIREYNNTNDLIAENTPSDYHDNFKAINKNFGDLFSELPALSSELRKIPEELINKFKALSCKIDEKRKFIEQYSSSNNLKYEILCDLIKKNSGINFNHLGKVWRNIIRDEFIKTKQENPSIKLFIIKQFFGKKLTDIGLELNFDDLLNFLLSCSQSYTSAKNRSEGIFFSETEKKYFAKKGEETVNYKDLNSLAKNVVDTKFELIFYNFDNHQLQKVYKNGLTEEMNLKCNNFTKLIQQEYNCLLEVDDRTEILHNFIKSAGDKIRKSNDHTKVKFDELYKKSLYLESEIIFNWANEKEEKVDHISLPERIKTKLIEFNYVAIAEIQKHASTEDDPQIKFINLLKNNNININTKEANIFTNKKKRGIDEIISLELEIFLKEECLTFFPEANNPNAVKYENLNSLAKKVVNLSFQLDFFDPDHKHFESTNISREILVANLAKFQDKIKNKYNCELSNKNLNEVIDEFNSQSDLDKKEKEAKVVESHINEGKQDESLIGLTISSNTEKTEIRQSRAPSNDEPQEKKQKIGL
ncbi:hypothetical protein OAC51_04345 [Flavobacteriaceae bacterium]|nr:hypothetical protein [Flavobacteriaceae bacterium]